MPTGRGGPFPIQNKFVAELLYNKHTVQNCEIFQNEGRHAVKGRLDYLAIINHNGDFKEDVFCFGQPAYPLPLPSVLKRHACPYTVAQKYPGAMEI